MHKPHNHFETTFSIGNKNIGENHPVFIIAEAGVAHFGDFEMAQKLFQLARDGGADAFKLQVFDVDALFGRDSQAWKDRLRNRVLKYEQIQKLKEMCWDFGLAFILTAHDESKAHWLSDLDVDAIKIGSGERNNIPFFKTLAAMGKPVIISTGMYSMDDVSEALSALNSEGCEEVGVLHCVTSYPAPLDDVNLRAMDQLREIFPGPVGYSDHTENDLAVLSAVARGAKIIEKHITILRDVPNAQDWKVSSGPEDFPELVKNIRRIETLLGHGRKEQASSEKEATTWALKSLVAIKDLPAGYVLTASDLVAKRPGNGIAPNQIKKIDGRKLRRSLSQDEPISWEDLT